MGYLKQDCYQAVVTNMYSKGAVNIDFENQYFLSSGVKSPLYIEAGVLVSSFDARADIAGALLFWINEHCREQKTKVDAVVGIAQGGIVWASSVANSKALPMLYAFAKKKDHGLFNQIAGELPFDGCKVIVLDDAITTGYSALEVVKALREGKNGKKAEVLGVYSIFDWNFPEVNDKFKELGVEKHHLVSVQSLLDYGVQNGMIDAETVEKLKTYYQK